MTEYRVVNSSPLITLAKIGRLDLLEGPGVSVVIPAPVAQEVARWPKEDPARKALAAGWGGIPVVVQTAADVLEWGLGLGESGVITLARSMSATAVIDDKATHGRTHPGCAFDRHFGPSAEGGTFGSGTIGSRDPGGIGRCRATTE